MKKFFGLLIALFAISFGSFGTEIKAAPTEMSVVKVADIDISQDATLDWTVVVSYDAYSQVTNPNVLNISSTSVSTFVQVACESLFIDAIGIKSITEPMTGIYAMVTTLKTKTHIAQQAVLDKDVEVMLLCYTVSIAGTHNKDKTDTKLTATYS